MKENKKIEGNLLPLFSSPVYISKLNRVFSKKELKFFNSSLKKENNTGNKGSKEKNILNNINLINLKKDILNHVYHYCNEILLTENIKPYISLSWLNWTKENEYHHIHAHQNSFLSGVFYINAKKDIDNITFFKREYEIFNYKRKDYNFFNSLSWKVLVETYNIVIFPSNLIHEVEIKKENNERCSLAFNIFIKGTLGSKETSTFLKL